MWNGASVNMGEGKQYMDPVLFAKDFGLYLEHSRKPQLTYSYRKTLLTTVEEQAGQWVRL